MNAFYPINALAFKNKFVQRNDTVFYDFNYKKETFFFLLLFSFLSFEKYINIYEG